MFHYVKKYPISLIVICIIIYLSFFKPPTIDVDEFLYWDKIVHICMYGGLSGMLWIEFLRNHRGNILPLPHVLIGAIICPIVFSGVVELLQEYCTKYRSGDWLDFGANSIGVILGSLVSYYVIRPFFMK